MIVSLLASISLTLLPLLLNDWPILPPLLPRRSSYFSAANHSSFRSGTSSRLELDALHFSPKSMGDGGGAAGVSLLAKTDFVDIGPAAKDEDLSAAETSCPRWWWRYCCSWEFVELEVPLDWVEDVDVEWFISGMEYDLTVSFSGRGICELCIEVGK